MDQQVKQGNGSVWTKVILVVLAGLIGYFVGRGNTDMGPVAQSGNEDEEEGAALTSEALGTGTGEETGAEATPPAAQTGPRITLGTPPTPPAAMTGENTITAVNQAAGSEVVVEKTALEAVSWVAIHEDRAGAPGNILGAKRFDRGTQTGMAVSLLRPTTAGGRYYAMVHRDDGDADFEFKTDDAPLTTSAGAPVMAAFTAQ